jgi:hypothetical protein
MDLEQIKRGLRAEIKKRENEQYLTFQCNVRQMCKDVLAKLEEQESEIAELKDDVTYWKKVAKKNMDDNVAMARERAKAFESEHRHKYKRCVAMAMWCDAEVYHIMRTPLCDMSEHEYWQYENDFWQRWRERWLELAEKFKEAK